jgi:hypothetical protein
MVKIVANRNCPEIKLAGLTVGPFDEGNEYEVFLWVGKELASTGMVHFREDDVSDMTKLNQTHYREGSQQIPGQITQLPEDFYPRLRRFIADLKLEASKEPESEKYQDYNRAKYIARDIVNSRLKKIVALASAPKQTDQVLNRLTSEERFLYDQLLKLISEWKSKILENGER